MSNSETIEPGSTDNPLPQKLTSIPESHIDLFDYPNVAHVATLNADGSPTVSPVWVSYDGKNVCLNTAEGRRKARNLHRDPRIAVSVHDNSNIYRYAEVRGTASLSHADADEHIDELSEKYLGIRPYANQWSEDEVRVKIRIEADSVVVFGTKEDTRHEGS